MGATKSTSLRQRLGNCHQGRKRPPSLTEEPGRYVTSRMHQHRFLAMPVLISHAYQVYDLYHHHADPFDRLLIAQSQMESLPLISKNGDILRYDVEVAW